MRSLFSTEMRSLFSKHVFWEFPHSEMVVLMCLIGSLMAWWLQRKPPTTKDYARYTFQRKNLDRIRKKSGQFPKPYPNGWYRVCGSEDLRKGQVLSITCCGREMVAFRGKDGRAGVLHAFCPHLGTHLGHGGTVQACAHAHTRTSARVPLSCVSRAIIWCALTTRGSLTRTA